MMLLLLFTCRRERMFDVGSWRMQSRLRQHAGQLSMSLSRRLPRLGQPQNMHRSVHFKLRSHDEANSTNQLVEPV